MADPIGYEDAVVAGILQELDPMADALGQSLGLPPGGQRYSPSEIDTMWSASPIADPEQRAQQMLAMYQQGMSVEEITDHVYPNRRKLIETSRPKLEDRIAFAQQQERRMARLARDQGHHIAGVEPWATITGENAPAQDTAGMGPMGSATPLPEATGQPSAPAGGLPAPAGAPPSPQPAPPPGWGQPGGQFSLTGMQP